MNNVVEVNQVIVKNTLFTRYVIYDHFTNFKMQI